MKEPTNNDSSQLIVMLTLNDLTVLDAEQVFERCKASKAQYWGMKEKPLPLDKMKALFAHMRACGKTTVLEVVSYDEQGAMHGAQVAVECGCDIVMGTMFSERVMNFLHEQGHSLHAICGAHRGASVTLRWQHRRYCG